MVFLRMEPPCIVPVHPVRLPAKNKKAQLDGVGAKPNGMATKSADSVEMDVVQDTDAPKHSFYWRWRGFKNPNRKDDLVLGHWEKVSADDLQKLAAATGTADTGAVEDGTAKTAGIPEEKPELPPSVSAFSVFNPVDPLVLTYTDSEYEQHLKSAEWSREETDYLFDLCRQYEARFVVIKDRYEYSPKADDAPRTERSYEDLQERYYGVTKKLLEIRYPLPDPNMKARMEALSFNKTKELERRAYVERLFNRPQEELQREEQLILEMRRLQYQFKRMEKERDAIRRALKPDTFGMHSLSQMLELTKRKSKKAIVELAGDAGADGASPKLDKKRKEKSLSRESIISSAGGSGSAGPSQKKEKKVVGVVVRSQTLTVPKSQSLQQKVSLMLEELGVPIFPKMPTQQTVEQYQELTQNIVQLIEAKRQADKMEQELRHLEQQRQQLEQSMSPAPMSAGAISPAVGEDGQAAIAQKRLPPSSSASGSVKRTRKH